MIEIEPAIPILRIFDAGRAMEFYREFLGMAVDWEHRFEPHMPLYCQVSRGKLVLHLSEHVGDTAPAARVFIRMKGVAALRDELAGRHAGPDRLEIAERDWGREITVTDPFHNRLTFCESQG